MNGVARLGMSAGAVALVVFGCTSAPTRTGGDTIAPTTAEAAGASLAPTPTPPAFPPAGELAVGRYSLVLEGVRLSLAISTPGWISNGIFGVDRATGVTPEGAGFIFWAHAPDGVFADPCGKVKAPPTGSSVEELAAAVSAVPGIELVSGPSDVIVGGQPAKHLVVTIPEDAGCVAEHFFLWYASSVDQARYATELGSTIRIWIVDVDGSVVWIDGETYKGAGGEPEQALQQIVDSIEIQRHG